MKTINVTSIDWNGTRHTHQYDIIDKNHLVNVLSDKAWDKKVMMVVAEGLKFDIAFGRAYLRK